MSYGSPAGDVRPLELVDERPANASPTSESWVTRAGRVLAAASPGSNRRPESSTTVPPITNVENVTGTAPSRASTAARSSSTGLLPDGQLNGGGVVDVCEVSGTAMPIVA